MPDTNDARITEAFLSMLRTDYISLNDTDKLTANRRYHFKERLESCSAGSKTAWPHTQEGYSCWY